MKLVVLVDSSKEDFDGIAKAVEDENPMILDTTQYNEDREYFGILSHIIALNSSSATDVLLTKFSGRTRSAQELGDTCPEMIVTVSNNPSSKYYTEHPKNTVIDFIHKCK